ncbi:hypothetical protein D6D01_06120 [Aureobasidium pullulans]|uniref:Hyaluronan/mRNA-binding protein domain-containing protein n=1 Tax=Aureobasidium pullulans TaxID=5580 RepID=A0A4S9L3P6_AURPU|nr:hypothetical protein D6D01_06120 [Aureobasidium pullulans]
MRVAPIVTRSHKVNDRDHVGLANGTASPEEHLPRYFAKSGFSANDNPNRIKKSGNGKGNWGRQGEELEDMDDMYRPSKPRRRSNASAQLLDAMTSKFEVVEAEPMFKENVHGASAHDYAILEKTMSMESAPSEAGTTTSSEGDEGMAK